MNHHLQSKGITAKATLKDCCLSLMLEGNPLPEQQSMILFIRDGITSLGAKSIKSVKVYGWQTDEELPSWIETFDLEIKETIKQPLNNQEASLNPEAKTENNIKISYTDTKFQQTLQDTLSDCNLLVQINNVNPQIVILVNRETNKYIDYLQVTQVIKNKLKELRIKDFEDADILGEIISGNPLDFKTLLEPKFDIVLEEVDPLFKEEVIVALRAINLKEEKAVREVVDSLPEIIREKTFKRMAELLKIRLYQNTSFLSSSCTMVNILEEGKEQETNQNSIKREDPLDIKKEVSEISVIGGSTNSIDVEKGSSHRINIKSWFTNYVLALPIAWFLVYCIFPLFSNQSPEIRTAETPTVLPTAPASSVSDEHIICLADGCFTEKELKRMMYDSVCPKIVEDPSNLNYSECKKEGY